MPETVASLVAFLLLIVPGLLFEFLRETTRPARKYSVFRETALVVVTSVAFNAGALLVLGGLVAARPAWMPNVSELVATPTTYATEHYDLVARAVVIQVAFAALLALCAHWWLCRGGSGGNLRPEPSWWEVARGRLRRLASQESDVFVAIELDNGATIAGFLAGQDVDPDDGLRSLVLGTHQGTPLRVKPVGSSEFRDYDPTWAYVVVPAEHIRLGSFCYVQSVSPRP